MFKISRNSVEAGTAYTQFQYTVGEIAAETWKKIYNNELVVILWSTVCESVNGGVEGDTLILDCLLKHVYGYGFRIMSLEGALQGNSFL